MRDDLVPTRAHLRWPEAQIPVLLGRFIQWYHPRPYRLGTEIDPKANEQLAVLLEPVSLDPPINAEAGIIINALRSNLDLLASALAERNCKKPRSDRHFPIFVSGGECSDSSKGIESKK
jgi:hypothetical protein